uniref:Mediator of RNA polymerase II transcription subunit 22 n=1 Tax=Phallusia mammillata TaxID=59560 RepID=A0A6F9DJU1_9ASCI|nr:mediator of RNA polymerase II transcription subunit 22-like [Phallusia mammillata]
MAVHQSRQALSHTTQNLLNSYNKRLHDDVRAMMENFNEIIKSAQVEDLQQVDRVSQNYYDVYQMRVRAANIVRAGESLLRLTSELKTFVILNDFPSVNRHVEEQNQALNDIANKRKEQLVHLRDDFAIALHDLESEYYCSNRPKATHK